MLCSSINRREWIKCGTSDCRNLSTASVHRVTGSIPIALLKGVDGTVPMNDEINRGALGFAPLAALVSEGQLDVDRDTLDQKFSAEHYRLLSTIVF